MRLSVRPVMRVVTGLFGPWRTGLKVWYCRAYRCFRVRPSRLLGKAVRDEKKTARRRPFAPIKTVRTAFPSGPHPASPRKPISLVLPFIDSRGTHRRVRGGYPNGEGSDSKSDAGFAGCGFDSRALRFLKRGYFTFYEPNTKTLTMTSRKRFFVSARTFRADSVQIRCKCIPFRCPFSHGRTRRESVEKTDGSITERTAGNDSFETILRDTSDV